MQSTSAPVRFLRDNREVISYFCTYTTSSDESHQNLKAAKNMQKNYDFMKKIGNATHLKKCSFVAIFRDLPRIPSLKKNNSWVSMLRIWIKLINSFVRNFCYLSCFKTFVLMQVKRPFLIKKRVHFLCSLALKSWYRYIMARCTAAAGSWILVYIIELTHN